MLNTAFKNNKSKLFLIIILFFVFQISRAQAAVVSLRNESAEVVAGEPVKISVLLNTEQDSINAVEGVLTFPESLDVTLIESAKSIISFWVEEPRVDKTTVIQGARQIPFSGVIAGGVGTRDGKLFSIYLTPAKSAAIGDTFLAQLTNVKAVNSDGLGTMATTSVKNLNLRISAGTTAAGNNELKAAQSAIAADLVLPEEFEPILAQSKQIFDNKWFVAFFTSDLDSGVDYYEVQETSTESPRDSAWVRAQSPYLLVDQTLKSRVFVKAVDRKGNFRVELVERKTTTTRSGLGYILIGVLLVICLLTVEIWRIQRRKKANLPV